MTGMLSGYQKGWLRFNALAGVTAAAVVIPKSIAFASIAGLPVEVGLYVALVPMLVYALLGSSRVLSVSSTSTIAILTATELTLVLPGADPAHLMGAAAALALLVGGFLIAAGLLRLGFLANFISDPVLTGFKAGVGLVIVVDQVPKLLGVHIDRGHFVRQVLATLQHVPDTSRATVVLAAATLVILFGMEHFRPQVPAPLVAVVLGIAAAGILGLQQAGVGADWSDTSRDSSSRAAEPLADWETVARCARYCAHVLHRVYRCRSYVCQARRPTARAKPGIDRARRRQSGRELLSCLPCRGWNLPNGSERAGRGAHPGSRAGDSRNSGRDALRSVAIHQHAASGHAGCRGRRLHAATAQYD